MQYGGVNVQAELTKLQHKYGTLTITQRDTNDPIPYVMTVAAHPSGTSTLTPPTQVAAPATVHEGYYKLSDLLETGASDGLTMANSEFIIATAGVYITPVGWAGFRHSAGGTSVAFIFGVERNGIITFSQRPITSKQPTGGDISNVSGGGQTTLEVGDKVSAWLASDKAGDVTIGNLYFTLWMIQDLTP